MRTKRLKHVFQHRLGLAIGMVRESLPNRRQHTLQSRPIIGIKTGRQLRL